MIDRCGWFGHRWGKWSAPEKLTRKVSGIRFDGGDTTYTVTPSDYTTTETFFRQERTCLRCGLTRHTEESV